MPIYEYFCVPCKKQWEEVKKFAESDQPATCEICKQPALRSISRPAPAQFKGTGFYINDYKRQGK